MRARGPGPGFRSERLEPSRPTRRRSATTSSSRSAARSTARLYTADQPAPHLDQTERHRRGAGSARACERDYDSGLPISLKSMFEVYHDRLSGDNYGSDFVQKVYGRCRPDSAASRSARRTARPMRWRSPGPTVEGEILHRQSQCDASSAIRRPAQAFINVFALNSAVESSLNYAKISYYTPRLFGVQLARLVHAVGRKGRRAVPQQRTADVPTARRACGKRRVSYSDNFGPVSLGSFGGMVRSAMTTTRRRAMRA